MENWVKMKWEAIEVIYDLWDRDKEIKDNVIKDKEIKK